MKLLMTMGSYLEIAIYLITTLLWLIWVYKVTAEKQADRVQLISYQRQLTALAEFWRGQVKWRKAEKKRYKKQLQEQSKQQKKQIDKPYIFVIDFNGDTEPSQLKFLTKEIDTLLNVAKSNDEVLLRITSPGGSALGYFSAANQLKRIRDADIYLTASVDVVAASGGYLMASVANHIIAAPNAIVGSIGVYTALPNIHSLLTKWGLTIASTELDGASPGIADPRIPWTKAQAERTQLHINKLHRLFIDQVCSYRQLNEDKTCTGEIWGGQAALEHRLIDEIKPSNEWLTDKVSQQAVYFIKHAQLKKPAWKTWLNLAKWD